MKKITLLSAVVWLALSSSVYAQSEGSSDPVKANAFKANPLGLIIGIGKINYERRLSASTSVQLGASYFSYGNNDGSFSGLGLIPELRWYVGGHALEGFYVAPFAKYRNFSVKDKDDGSKYSVNVYGGGAKAGMQWLMGKKDNFIMDLAFGGKYQDFNYREEDNEGAVDIDNFLSGFSPELHFAIGFAF